MLSLHLPHPFFVYLINPYPSKGERWDMWCQWPWTQQLHESTTSRLVVGHVDPAFRDLGVNATGQIIGATYRRKTHVKKKHDASKTLGEWTKKQRTPLEFYKLEVVSSSNNVWVAWATLIGISLVLFHHLHSQGPKPPLTRSATTR
jgi:hypothetical protein